MPGVSYPHGDPNRIVRDVLAQHAYRWAAPATAQRRQPSLAELAWRWFARHVLEPIFGSIAHAVGASEGIGTAVGLVLVVAALASLAWVAFRLATAFARARAAGRLPATPGTGVLGALATARSVDAWRAEARDAAARGAYARAIAALFAAAQVALDVRGVVRFDAARTPGEYRRLVRRERLAAAEPFDALSETFVRAAYAPVAPDAAAFATAERALARLEPAIASA